VAAPILFGLILVLLISRALIPPEPTTKLGLPYKFIASASQPGAQARSPSAKAPAGESRESADGGKESRPKDPVLSSIANQLSGRYAYAIASGFLWLAAAAALMLGTTVAIARLNWRWVAGALVAFLAIAWWVAQRNTPYDWGEALLVESLLNTADKETALAPLAAPGGTGTAVTGLVRLNTYVSLVGVGMILLALYALSLRPPPGNLCFDDLRRRLTAIRCALALGSVILVLAVLASKTLLDWPLALLVDEQRAALRPLADALTFELGGVGTIALIAAFAPAIVAWMLDVEQLKDEQARRAPAPAGNEAVGPQPQPQPRSPTAADPSAADLVFAPVSMMMSVVAVLAPVLASPFVDGLRAILPLLGKSG
jgi:hypothetical protein